jgi:cyclic pyranopterin phosphate synthase
VPKLTHTDSEGRARMVDVSGKPESAREAIAEGLVLMSKEALALVAANDVKKGDVRAAAELAGVMAAKRTAELIPLCHTLPLEKVSVEIEPCEDGLRVTANVKTWARTGVEMEALTAVSIACLTIYDMLKAVDRSMTIADIRLLAKRGGASGAYVREQT